MTGLTFKQRRDNPLVVEIVKLEDEFDQLRRRILAADQAAAEAKPLRGWNAVQIGGANDILPLRDRLQVIEARLARLRDGKIAPSRTRRPSLSRMPSQ